LADNIKLLEELVVEAVDRLQGLTRERDGLRRKAVALEERLNALERVAVQDEERSQAAAAWEARRAQAVRMLREALSDLRGDGDAG
jgi:hypothetical protein